MRRKLISLMLCGIMAFTLVGCGNEKDKDTSNTSSNIIETDSADLDESKDDSQDEREEEKSSNKTEYKTMTIDEAIEFNSTKIYEFEEYLKGKGFELYITDDNKTLINGPRGAIYVGNGEFSQYKSLGYSAEVKDNLVAVRYEFHYYEDREGIQAGTVEIPKARDLLIAEPYKIMTGDEISDELLDKIDEVIEEGFRDDDQDETTIEINGPFKVKLRVDGIDIVLKIVSDGDGKGN